MPILWQAFFLFTAVLVMILQINISGDGKELIVWWCWMILI